MSGVRHTVLLKFVDSASAEQKQVVLDGLQGLPAAIPQVLDYQVGGDLGLDPGRNVDIAVTADFASKEDYEIYAKHPVHIALITNHIKPILAQRTACQFSVDVASTFQSRKRQKVAPLKLNTSNQNKLKEFRRIFAKHGQELEVTQVDLREIDSTPEKVVAHKASAAGEGVLIEDTSLDVEGEEVGVNVRWMDFANKDDSDMAGFKGKKATWRVLLGVLRGGQVSLYEGTVNGILVLPRGDKAFGFDPVFQPEGSTTTLGEDKPDSSNARAKAIDALLTNKIHSTMEPIFKWDGPWQHD